MLYMKDLLDKKQRDGPQTNSASETEYKNDKI